jgi:hypothetical protein
VRDEADPGGLLEEVRGDGPERDARRGLPRRGPLEDRAGVVEAVLAHADEVGVPWARTGERGVACPFERGGVLDRVGGHDVHPLGPLAVGDLDRHRSALAEAVAHATEDPDLVLLERHPGAATVPQPPPGESALDVGGGHGDAGGQTLQDADERGTVRLPRGQPAQHGAILPRLRTQIGPRPGNGRGPIVGVRARSS